MRRGERYASAEDMIENEGKKNDNKDSLRSFQGPKKPPKLSRTSCSSSNHRSGSRGSGGFGGAVFRFCFCRSRSLVRGILKRSNRSRFLNLRGIFIDFRRCRNFGLGLRLEEIADTGRQAAPNLSSFGFLLILLLLLILLRTQVRE
jgi:hypothetical protein